MPKAKKKVLGYFWTVLAVLALGAAGIGSRIFFGPDNMVEQTAEKIIETNTGISLDLSPDSN